MDFVIVGLGGFIGAILRYYIYLGERSLGAHPFPFGTLVINLSGCLIAGFLLAVVERAIPIHRQLILLGSMGLVGSFTTFSTLSVESLQLIRTNQILLAFTSVAANVVLGILFVWAGRYVMLKL